MPAEAMPDEVRPEDDAFDQLRLWLKPVVLVKFISSVRSPSLLLLLLLVVRLYICDPRMPS
ncbi:hypothetical protein ACRE_078050 [Hapsidospora chrysogenum ATCC 11550]|uniref:Uncharacterized protein n=1 Tax=Hapsidospora chrysogenum (strain ATCC 11550 / CBS 779.69 / DSM 880 / IAM 14645 / JCM 23072 / IMI 49137) TaxID=857340 RepID=A0A086SWJ8_HAPC1|nr:hypothetical protein ACRE_078050 [Hapsidospora chrysogenum ATCC 11550]